jgi:dihydroorotate dehydrogenase
MLAETYVRVEGTFPLVGVGGISSPATALQKLRAGASLLQLYTALVFQGVGLVNEIKGGLRAALAPGQSVSSLVGTEAAAITAQQWPA